MPTAIPVFEDTREDLKEIKKQHNATYDSLINAMLADIDASELDCEPARNDRGGTTAECRKDDAVNSMLKENGLKGDSLDTAMNIVEASYDNDELLRREAKSIAAAADYLIRMKDRALVKHTQEEVANDYGVSKMTVRNTYHIMCESARELI